MVCFPVLRTLAALLAGTLSALCPSFSKGHGVKIWAIQSWLKYLLVRTDRMFCSMIHIVSIDLRCDCWVVCVGAHSRTERILDLACRRVFSPYTNIIGSSVLILQPAQVV